MAKGMSSTGQASQQKRSGKGVNADPTEPVACKHPLDTEAHFPHTHFVDYYDRFAQLIVNYFLDGERIMAKPATLQIKLVSTADTGYYYVTKKNPRTKPEKLELMKYDPRARKHVLFKESKIK